jgi:hypothetical protein
MAIDMLSFQGVDVQKAYETLASAGIQNDVARQVIGVWIGEAVMAGRSFQYSRLLADTDVDSQPATFARTFVHQDWIDGTSVVQAGETPTEKGFNDRFHKIENDLDKLGALVAQSFASLNDVRATLAVSLREISAELNRINADLADIRRNLPSSKTPIGPVGKATQFLGKTKYFDQSVMVFQDADGRFINLPDTTVASYPPSAELRAPNVAEIFGRDKDIRDAFGTSSVTKDQVIAKFGDRISSNGTPLSSLLAALPANESFQSLDDMVNKLADRDVLLVKGMGIDTNLRSSLGVADTAATSAAPSNRVEGVSPALGDALAVAGVKTVADLGKLAPDKLVEISKAQGIDLSLSAASALVTRGRVLGGI